MRTVVLGPRPAELDALIARRRALGLDTFDEVWKGDYHMAPAPHANHGELQAQLAVLLRPLARPVGLWGTGPFNLGEPDDFRVPDWGLHPVRPSTTYVSTAAMVIEILSPNDETWDKLTFYADHEVDELLVVSPSHRAVQWFALEGGRYVSRDHSALLGEASRHLPDDIDWPKPLARYKPPAPG